MANSHRMLSALAALLLAAGQAGASTFLIEDDELDPAIFPAVAESIRANLHRAAEPRTLSAAETRRVLRSLERLEEWVAQDDFRNKGRINAERLRVNELLAPQVARSNNDAEVVCRRIRAVGSNIPTTDCRTRAQRELDKQAAQEEVFRLRQLQALDDMGRTRND